MASPVLPPPPLTTPLTQKDGTPSLPWARWFQLLQVILSGQSAPRDWQDATLNAGWTNFSGFTTEFRKDASGTVWIQGLVTATSVGDVFTLPEECWPVQQKDFATAVSTGGTEGHGRIKISTAGVVTIAGSNNPSTWGSLDCSFPTTS